MFDWVPNKFKKFPTKDILLFNEFPIWIAGNFPIDLLRLSHEFPIDFQLMSNDIPNNFQLRSKELPTHSQAISS